MEKESKEIILGQGKQKVSRKQLSSDEIFKKIMGEQVAAREFLEYYLPKGFKELVDLSDIRIEKETYVTEDLRERLSDVVYSVFLKDSGNDKGKRAFVYTLIEHQSSSDYWISFRLWQYCLLLCERHKPRKGDKVKKGENPKLPLICPIVVYANEESYNAPRSFWELFEDSAQAKGLMGDEYLLVDLQKQSDNEIEQKKHLGMMEYMLKHIHARDMLQLWESFLTRFKTIIELDKETGYIYIKWFLWYSDAKVPEDKQEELVKIIGKHLNKIEQKTIMRTIAEKYIDEGLIQGIQIGEARGEAKLKEEKINMAKKMLVKNKPLDEIIDFTGLTKEEIEKLN